MNWKATLPRATPPAGETSVVLAVKTCRGTRLELAGDLPEQQALAAWNIGQMSKSDFAKIEHNLKELGVLE